MSLLDELIERAKGLSPEDQRRVMEGTAHRRWIPTPGPQLDAYFCEADELFYGGQAGGAKTDLIVGLSIEEHQRSLVLRRTNKEADKLVDRYIEVLGGREGWNGQHGVWRLAGGKVIDIGGCQHEDDKQKRKGTPHDFIGFDEISDFTITQYRFITAWNRSEDPKQRCRIVAAGNPPTTPEGLWVIKHWGPWLDQTHPNPAKPGELRWFTTVDDEDVEVDGPGPHMVDGKPEMARSRSFIPSKLSDNPFLARTNYRAVLATLPAELRSAYLEGDFQAGLKDAEWQVIPTAWIIAAQDRWTPDGQHGLEMTAMALDPAGGGRDSAELALRYGGWFAPLVSAKGEDTADGSATCGIIVRHRRSRCPVVVDVGGGYGGAVIERLKDNSIAHHRFNGAERSSQRTRDGQLPFANKRAEAWWRFREELNPDQEGGSAIALPPDPELRADLAAPRWELTARGIQIELKEDLKKRLGRSPGKGDAVVMSLSEGNKAAIKVLARSTFDLPQRMIESGFGRSKPKVHMGHEAARRRR